ncbi:MAG TPA: serine/threonine-protein kinase, partial [Trebonia sp.]|nr:serine/threonine-protein kinase [Trebonia sp.]
MGENFPPYLGRFRPGSMLAGYRLEALAGTGGMAAVFRARDERLDRLVALKILEPSRAAAADPAYRERFIAESRAAARVDHPNIIPVYEADEADGVLFIAMRFVRGGDLRTVLERQGALPPERAVEVVAAVASALDAAHEAGLVHRDIKPANILVDTRPGRPDQVYLSDFGIAKGAAAAAPLTQTGFVVGTVDYLAPENISGQHADGRADQYALGCVAYQLLTGEPPFHRDDPMAVMAAHLHAPPPSVTARRPDLPGAADTVMATVMAKAPDQRYGSCSDFAEALRGALGVAPYRSSRPVPLSAPPPHPATQPGAAMPATPAAPPPAPYVPPTVRDARVPVHAPGSPGPARPPERKTVARRPPRAWPGVRVWLPLTILAAAVALIVVAVLPHLGRQSAQSSANLGASACGTAFPGYPGQQGSVTVNSVQSGGGTRLAVGGADGHPAIWHCAGGSWHLVAAATVPALQGAGELASVAHGPGGWIAVGDGGSGAVAQPVAVTSADGVSWRQVNSSTAFTGPGACVTAVAAGQHGYAAVGENVSGSRVFAAMWPSADSQSWALGDNDTGGRLDGSKLHSAVDAVTATPGGFVAVGTHGSGGVIWTSPDGQQWTFIDYRADHVPHSGVPAGALLLVAASGSRIVTAGYAVTASGDVPVVVVSTDGGLHWNAPIVLGTPNSEGGRVTALTATGSGFAAAG